MLSRTEHNWIVRPPMVHTLIIGMDGGECETKCECLLRTETGCIRGEWRRRGLRRHRDEIHESMYRGEAKQRESLEQTESGRGRLATGERMNTSRQTRSRENAC